MHILFRSGDTILMKTQRYTPDFKSLCTPGQSHNKENLLSQLIFFFFIGSAAGFLWEVLIFLVKEHRFRNRGFFYGPWLPVYGVGAVFLYVLLIKRKKHPAAVFLLSAVLGTAWELAAGWLLDAVWNLRYWDYSGYLFHFRGYICLWSALGFGLAGTVWVCFLSGFLSRLWLLIPRRIRHGIQTILLLLFLIDCAAALIFPNTGRGITF